MISDVLFDAIYQINYYLKRNIYDEETTVKIIKLREAMNELRAELDRCPEEKEGEK